MADQLQHHGAQVESQVEAVGEGAEIAGRMLGEIEGLVSRADGGLQVAQDGVDPGELGQLAWLALTDHDPGVRATRIDDASRARQAIATHGAARAQVDSRPVGHCPARAAAELTVLQVQRVTGFGQRHSCHERHLVLAPALAGNRAFAAAVGVVDLDATPQRFARHRLAPWRT